MTIKGDHTLETTIEALWPLFQDPAVLSRISPGTSTIEPEGKDTFKAISEISIGPVKGSFAGLLSIEDKRPGEGLTLVLDQKSKMGNARADIKMDLEEIEEGKTRIIYNGKARVTGTLASMGQRILGGVIKSMTRKVFAELDSIVLELNSKEGSIDEDVPVNAAPITDTNMITQLRLKILDIWKFLFK